MLRASGLHDALTASLSGGVEAVVLLTTTGVPLSSASINPGYGRSPEHTLTHGIVATMWRSYAGCDLAYDIAGELTPESLEALLVDVGDHRLCMVGVGGSAILCLMATRSVEQGLLKLKAASLQAHMDRAFRSVAKPAIGSGVSVT